MSAEVNNMRLGTDLTDCVASATTAMRDVTALNVSASLSVPSSVAVSALPMSLVSLTRIFLPFSVAPPPQATACTFTCKSWSQA